MKACREFGIRADLTLLNRLFQLVQALFEVGLYLVTIFKVLLQARRLREFGCQPVFDLLQFLPPSF